MFYKKTQENIYVGVYYLKFWKAPRKALMEEYYFRKVAVLHSGFY